MKQQINNIKMHAEAVMLITFFILVVVALGSVLKDLGTVDGNIQQIVIEAQEVVQ